MEPALARLGPALGVAPYDLRLRLAGALPAIVERTADAGRAREILALLREAGHGAVACDLTTLTGSECLPSLRAFELEPTSLVLVERSGERRTLRYVEVVAAVRTLHCVEEERHSQLTTRRLAVGRAVLTGGLAITKQVTREKREDREDREQVLYVYAAGSASPWLLREHELSYGGLGAARGRTTAEGFQTLVAALATKAPAALHDERFFRQRRREAEVRLDGNVAASVTRRSNAAATDLAVHLLVLAHAEGQL